MSSRFIEPEAFAAEMDRHLGELRTSPKLAGRRPHPDAGRGPPQAPRRAQRQWRRVAATLIKQLDELAADLKIQPLGGR